MLDSLKAFFVILSGAGPRAAVEIVITVLFWGVLHFSWNGLAKLTAEQPSAKPPTQIQTGPIITSGQGNNVSVGSDVR